MSTSTPSFLPKHYPQATIHLAQPKDLPTISKIVEAAYSPYIPLINKKPAPMTADYTSLLSLNQLFVLQIQTEEEKEEAVGCICLSPVYQDPTANQSKADSIELNNLALQPSVQGKGLGKLLVKFAEDYARDQSVRTLTLYTNVKMEGNLVLYPRVGFKEVGRKVDEGFERVYFVKELE